MRFTVKLLRSGKSLYANFPKPLLEQLNWTHGEDLMFLVQPDKTVRILTLEQWALEYHHQQRAAERAVEVGAST